MAQKTQVILVDDVDGSEATQTITFALDGVSYEIDLNDEHAAALRDAVAPYVGHARRAGGQRRQRSSSRSTAAATTDGPSTKEIREWARENGWDVPDRGRVSSEIREAYDAAH